MLSNLIVLFIFSIFVSFFIKFLDFCFNENNIFDFYYRYISNKFNENKPKLFKVLGGCIYCFGTWIYIFIFIIFNIYYQLPLIFLFMGIGINYISIDILNKHLGE